MVAKAITIALHGASANYNLFVTGFCSEIIAPERLWSGSTEWQERSRPVLPAYKCWQVRMVNQGPDDC